MECLPLPEKVFREAIKNNYQGSKFRQDLSGEQVRFQFTIFFTVLICYYEMLLLGIT